MKGTSIHHWAWPRRKFCHSPERRVTFKLSCRVHEAYHKFWFENCRDFIEKRPCKRHWCRFACICYYSEHDITF